MPAPCGERQKQHDRREPRTAWRGRRDGAPRAEHVAGCRLRRVVEARVVDRPGGEACPCQAGRGDDAEAIAPKQKLPQTGSTAPGKSRRRSFVLRLLAMPTPKWRRCAPRPRPWSWVVHERNPDVVPARIGPACPLAGEISSRQQSDTTPFPKGFCRCRPRREPPCRARGKKPPCGRR